MSDPILEVKGIAHAFGGLTVLRDVSFSVARGGIAGLIGPNGSGKTTLFNIASGFLIPAAGEIRLESRAITGDSVPARSRAGLIRTFQTPKVFGHMTVAENVAMGLYMETGAGFAATMLRLPSERREGRRIRAEAAAMMERFGLSPLRASSRSLVRGWRRRSCCFWTSPPRACRRTRCSGCAGGSRNWPPRASRSCSSRTTWG
jgi:ABC-type branched-subunit amino acid transport system ATPase component